MLPISNTIRVYSLDLLRRCVLSNSQTRPFYCHLLKEKNKYTQKTLIGRTANISNQNGVNLLKYI